MKDVKVLIPTGFGENCSADVAAAFSLAGAKPSVVHINDILSSKVLLRDFHIFNWSGGFLDGDDLGSAKAGASRLHSAHIAATGRTFLEELIWFKDQGHLIGGQCNGFQLFVKSGLLPGIDTNKQQVTLTKNDSGKFEDRWVNLKINKKSPCVWTKGIDTMFLPVRHGEGKLVVQPGKEGERILRELKAKNLIVMQYSTKAGAIAKDYPLNPNGAVESAAGMCDETGRIFALMPHPEAHVSAYTHPYWTRIKQECERKGKKFSERGDGLVIFKNAVDYIREEVL